jgi:hypothetical protein
MPYTNIDDPSAHFQAFTYTGTGTNNSITLDGNSDLQPDLYWYKTRSNSNYHYLADSSRGTTNYIYPNDSLAEGTGYTGYVQSFDTNGVTLGGGDSGTNTGGTTFANWVWKANGGTTSTDTTSSITSTVQVNSDAGFSIVTYTGDGTTTGGFGHGLGVAPKVVFVKRRNAAANWCVYHESIGAGFYLQLDTTAAQQSGPWQALAPSSTTVIVYGGGLVNGNGDTYLAYCFAEKQGYSKFGKYVGNGSADGTFVYTGFKPAFLIMKRTDSTGAWHIFDNKRLGYNINNNVLQADSTAAELAGADYPFVDILSNGFKTRRPTYGPNVSGATYIYMAFAENPFVTSTGVPTTAR